MVRTDEDLLPGEDGAEHRDARHWVAVYAELLRFVDGTLLEVAGPSRTPLEARRARFQRRHDFWAQILQSTEK